MLMPPLARGVGGDRNLVNQAVLNYYQLPITHYQLPIPYVKNFYRCKI